MKNSWNYLMNGSNGSYTTATYEYVSGMSRSSGTCKASTATVGTQISSTGISVARNESAFMTALYTIGPIAVVRMILIIVILQVDA